MESHKFNPEDEKDREISLNLPGGEFVLSRENGRLYTHLGHLAMYDHVFVTGENQTGFYIFRFVENFGQLALAMMEREYPSYINQTEVAKCDVDAYNRAIERSLGDLDHVPDEWV